MTDPNVLTALKELADAVAWIVPPDVSQPSEKARKCVDLAFKAIAAAEKPAAQTDGPVGIAHADADAGLAAVRGEVAAAPTVAAVNFEGGRAGGSEWLAATHSEEPFRFVTVRLDIRPGEDAGETVAKMLAACGRMA